MKIGLPKLRLSRKLLIITLGITVLLGGTSAAALYFKSSELGLASTVNTIGGECTDVQTMVLKTPSNRLWLRRFIRMENASGPDRVRTALRVAGLLAKKNAVDLIHVSVLDSHGPTLRSQMRARSVGAEVLIAMKPDNLPEMKSPAMATYYEGPVSDEGRYYGDKVVVDIDEIGAMMTAMRSVEEKPDCVSPEKAEDAEAKPNDHGKKDAKANDHGKKEDHGAKPEEAEGNKSAENHGEEPAKEQSFFDSMLSMVGLGGGDETPAAEDEAKASDHEAKPVAEKPEQAAEDASPEKAKHDEQAATEDHGEQPAVAKAEGHDAEAKTEASAEGSDKAEARADPAPAEEEPAPSAENDDHAEPAKKKPDEHALADMPVGD